MRIFSSLLILLAVCGSSLAGDASARVGPVLDNSALLPKILPDADVKMEGLSPDWVKSLIFAEVRIETATPEGTFAAAVRVLDHYAEMGVNALWITPIYQRPAGGNGYGNFGPHTVEPSLTGAATAEGSYEVIKAFVTQAHRRNIRIFFDIVVWGTDKSAPLVAEHPEFYRRQGGNFVFCWGGWTFDWNSAPLRAWFTKAAVDLIQKTGADGFRVDLAPEPSGYFFKEVRDALYAQGRKVVIFSECPNERKDTFDFEQVGVYGWLEEPEWFHADKLEEQKRRFGLHWDYLLRANIVDVVKSGAGIGKPSLQQEGKGGQFRFYVSNLANHDDPTPFVWGSRVRFGYTAIFAPYIPMWYIGEEWINPKSHTPLYLNTIDWRMRDHQGRAFFEDAKRFIRIRRTYPEIFENFPASSRDANIAKVQTTCNGQPNNLQAYARYAPGKAILIVPNYYTDQRRRYEITPDYRALGLAGPRYRITNLMTQAQICDSLKPPKTFTVSLDPHHLGIFLIECK